MKKTAMWKRAKPEERALWIIGIEPRYWSVSPASILPRSFTVDRVCGETTTVSASKQSGVIKKISEDPECLKYPTIVGVGSEPTEGYGMAFATNVAKIALKNGLQVAVLDLGNIPSSSRDLDRLSRLREAELVIIHNMTSESDSIRLQLAKDWINRCSGIFCIFVVAGTDPLSFADTKLRRPIDACFKFEGAVQRIGEY